MAAYVRTDCGQDCLLVDFYAVSFEGLKFCFWIEVACLLEFLEYVVSIVVFAVDIGCRVSINGLESSLAFLNCPLIKLSAR